MYTNNLLNYNRRILFLTSTSTYLNYKSNQVQSGTNKLRIVYINDFYLILCTDQIMVYK